MIKEKKIAVVGLGYVGLPLAVEFGKLTKTIGFDINEKRVNQLNSGYDSTTEIESEILNQTLNNGLLSISSNPKNISLCDFYIVTVPTPIDEKNRPILTPLIKACETIGEFLKKGDIVVFESTVYPGASEEDCVPVLEKISGLRLNKDFFIGYSPERINPGDKIHTLTNIVKITSGSTAEVAEIIDSIYRSIIKAGTYKASSIRVAEAAKVIENSQRDINIAFMNELAKIFNILKIDTNEVIEAASSKWNFLKFKPGLVGGHCIGVDPYYLAQKAQEIGFNPEMILAGRRMNDSMGKYVAIETIKLMIAKGNNIKSSKLLILGITFKENCPDIRNSKIIDIYKELLSFNIDIDVFDPYADYDEVYSEYGIKLKNDISSNKYSAIIIATAHKEFLALNLNNSLKNNGVIYDVKGILDKNISDGRL